MTLKVLKKIQTLVNSGVIVIGNKPIGAPSLNDDKDEFNTIVKKVWESHKTNVHYGKSLPEALNNLNILPDFQYNSGREDMDIRFVHRKLNDTDIY